MLYDDLKHYMLIGKEQFDSDSSRLNYLEKLLTDLIPQIDNAINKYETLKNSRLEILKQKDDLIDDYNDLLHEYKKETKKSEKLEKIMKEKSIRARKLGKDHSGYICIGSREVTEKYTEFDDYTHRKTSKTAIAYRTTFQLPYYSSYGIMEIRRLMINDLINRESLNADTYVTPERSALLYAMGIDYVYGFMSPDGEYPQKTSKNILYRVQLNCSKEYAEADLYTTAPLYLPEDIYKPGKRK